MTTQQLIYMDCNATSPVRLEVQKIMLKMLGFVGNASSIHKMGRESRKRIEQARGQIAKLVNAAPNAIILFTSGATEANNLVLKGSGMERILVSAIEHPSVLNAPTQLEIIPVLPSGMIDVAALDQMLEGNSRSTLISVMLVNNETGVIQPIDKIVEIAKRRGALVHTDAVQAAGRIPLDIQKLGVDYLTLSAHKMGGPQGAGCLILSNCVSVEPLIKGGNQEKNMRAGTENLAAIVGFGVAADIAADNIATYQKLGLLRDKIERALKAAAPELIIFGQESPRVSNTSMLSLPGISSETQLIALDMAGICVSNGSACSSGTVKISHVLKAMQVSEDAATSSLRISLGWHTSEKEVDTLIAEWVKMYQRIKERKK